MRGTPTAIKNHFAVEISLSRTQETKVLSKEPAARKPQLPAIGKEKLQVRAQRPGSLRRCGDWDLQGHSLAPTARKRWLRCRWGRFRLGRLGVWGCAEGAERRGHGARVRTPPHYREQWAERREQRKSRTMLGRAGDSARSAGPQRPPRLGPPAAELSLLLSPAFLAGAVKQWPPTSLRLAAAAAAFLPAGRLPRVHEDAARASGMGRARERGRARKQRARAGSRARGAPRGPAAAPAGFRLRRGLRRG